MQSSYRSSFSVKDEDDEQGFPSTRSRSRVFDVDYSPPVETLKRQAERNSLKLNRAERELAEKQDDLVQANHKINDLMMEIKTIKRNATELRAKRAVERKALAQEKAARKDFAEKIKKQECTISTLEGLVRGEICASCQSAITVPADSNRTPETSRATSTPTLVDPLEQLELARLRSQEELIESTRRENTALRATFDALKAEHVSQTTALKDELAQKAAENESLKAKVDRFQTWYRQGPGSSTNE